MEVVVVGLGFLFEILSVVFCLHYLYGEKPRFEVTTFCFVILEVLWMCMVYYCFDRDQIMTLMMYPIIAVYCGLRFGLDIKAIFINNILYMVALSVIQTTIMFLFSIILMSHKMEALDNLFINFLMLIIVVVGLRKCKMKKLSDVLQSNEKLVIISFVVVVVGFLLVLVMYKQSRKFETIYYAVLSMSVLMILVAAIDIGKHKLKVREAEAELRLHRLYESSFQNLIDDICAKQHEFDNHINTIYSQHFLYNNYEELVQAQKKYCNEIVNENHFNRLLSKGNPIILGFLYGKFSEIEKRKIEIIYKVNITNLESHVPVYKIVEILGNLLNNAVDAVTAIKKEGKIYIDMLEEKDKISIEVGNESRVIDYKCIQEFFKKGYSEKGKNRGYGLYNVKKICNEYNIELICQNRNMIGENWLIFRLIINKNMVGR